MALKKTTQLGRAPGDRQGVGGAFVEVFADLDAAQKHRELGHFKVFFNEIDDIEDCWTVHLGHAIG